LHQRGDFKTPRQDGGRGISRSAPNNKSPDAVMPDNFFRNVSYENWYNTTGNGDPAECYSIMKLMWIQKHMPDVYRHIRTVLGSKDFINYMLTGRMCTDLFYMDCGQFPPAHIRCENPAICICPCPEGLLHQRGFHIFGR
jgi:hypothetical protein